MKVVINLTEINGCYTKCLTENIEIIYKYSNDDYTSKDELVSWILELIKPAFYNKDAKPRFIHHLRNCKTKKAVLQLCLNAIANAVEYEVA